MWVLGAHIGQPEKKNHTPISMCVYILNLKRFTLNRTLNGRRIEWLSKSTRQTHHSVISYSKLSFSDINEENIQRILGVNVNGLHHPIQWIFMQQIGFNTFIHTDYVKSRIWICFSERQIANLYIEFRVHIHQIHPQN